MGALAAEAQQDTAAASLVAAELAFAAHADRAGIRDAFVTWLADGAVMFAPDPVDGRAFYRARPESGARLRWYPAWAGTSAAGDLGFTAGPSEYQAASGDTAIQHGQFASMWRRGDDGEWRVVLDLGTGHGRPRGKSAVYDPSRSRQSRRRSVAVPSLPRGGVDAVVGSLLALDSAFAHTAAARGTREALDQFADEAIRVQRPGEFPVTGRRRAVAAVAREGGSPRWEPRGGGASVSGDLGYTWGAVRWNGADDPSPHGYYLRVWRRTPDGWRVVMDFVAPRQS